MAQSQEYIATSEKPQKNAATTASGAFLLQHNATLRDHTNTVEQASADAFKIQKHYG